MHSGIVGLTVMVKVLVGPAQLISPLVIVGVTTMVATMGEEPVFTAMNEAILPEPVAARPIDGVLLVQAYVVVPPVWVVVKFTAVVVPPLFTSWFEGWFT